MFKLLSNAFMVTVAIIAAAIQMNAQAVLPTSRNFDAAAPTGWSDNHGNVTYANGQVGQAGRLDASGEYFQVFFAEEPGSVVYYLKGQPGSNNLWQGTFRTEESIDGINYTAMRTFNNDLPTGAFTQYTDNPLPSSRYIRFNYVTKVSGNVAIDEITVNTPVAGTTQEINITQSGNNVPSGMTFNVGNATTTDFVIENQGSVDALTISNAVLTGADAAQFSISNMPASVAANATASFTINFDGQGSGDKVAVLTISNNDASEGEYIINIHAVAGTLSSEPTAQATALTFTGTSAWDFNFGFTASSASSYLVLRKKGSAPTGTPVDGTSYLKGAWLGDAQIVHVGAAGTYNARSVEANSAYFFAVYAFNGSNGFENYLTTSPTTGMAMTFGSNPGATYNGVDVTSANVVNQLTAAMNPGNYFQVYYSNYIGTILNEFYVKDTAVAGSSQNAIECQYSGLNTVYPSTFQFTETGFSREHCYPQSWMPTYFDAGFDDSYEVSDLHNLMPVTQDDVNAVRSNYPYGEVATVTSSFLETKFGDNAIGQRVFEPRDSFKGDAARAIFYHSVKNNTSENDFSLPEQISIVIPYGQNEYVLKQWHFNDVPSNMEIARNEYVKTRQNNRNAFIDEPTYACYVRFANLTKWAPIVTVSGNTLTAIDPGVSYQWSLDGEEIDGATSSTYTATENGNYTVEVQQFEQCPSFSSAGTVVNPISVVEIENAVSVDIYPNPSNGQFRVNIQSITGGKTTLRILDITGKEVYSVNRVLNSGENNIAIEAQLAKGTYILEAISNGGRSTSNLVIE